MIATILQLENVNKRFGGVVVANNIELVLKRGEILGLIGPNGAGKTSLFNLISGFVPPDTGSIYLQEKRINELSIYERARLGISRTWQNVRLFRSMTVLDNLLISTRLYKGESIFQIVFGANALKKSRESSKEKAFQILDRIGLSNDWDKTVSELPFGQQKLVALGRSLMNDGNCLLLDEPMAGVEGQVYDMMKKVVRKAAEEGKAVCVIEHSISFIKDLCDSAVFMFSGQIIARGTMGELLSSQKLADIYFGAETLKHSAQKD